MHKCGIRLTMTEEVTGKKVYDMVGRRNKIIRLFLIHAINEKWFAKTGSKESLTDVLLSTKQYDNLTDMWRAAYRKEAPFEEDEGGEENVSSKT